MLYVICKSKNKIAGNEEIPKFNNENWEILETVKCRKNASRKVYDLIFCPVYQRLAKNEVEQGQRLYRLWNFKEEEVFNIER